MLGFLFVLFFLLENHFEVSGEICGLWSSLTSWLKTLGTVFSPFNLKYIFLFYVVATISFKIIDFLLAISIRFYNLEISDGRGI